MKVVKVLAGILLSNVLLFSMASTHANEPVSTGFLSNVAIGGKDTTAYHQLQDQDSAILGQKKYSVEWKGAKWLFASQQDAKKFAAEPERYSPAYNGYCANALSLGEGLIRTDGAHWLILEDQLYLFYAKRGSTRWRNGDYKKYKAEADIAWRQLLP